jgi:hypothetical protein
MGAPATTRRLGWLFPVLMIGGLVAAALLRRTGDSAADAAPAAGEISVLTLLREMADLDHLARLPGPSFRSGQAASTDRRSKRPEDGESWFANDDFVTDIQNNLVRVEPGPDGGKRYVLLDAAGPGAVVRIWTATPNGTLRLYVDGADEPALEAEMAELLSGQLPPFIPPLGQVTGRGYSLFFPFPYRERCLITVDSIAGKDPFSGQPLSKLYYQIGYRSYAPAQRANVRPFSEDEIARAPATLRRVATVLRDGLAPPSPPATSRFPKTTVDPGHPWQTTIVAPTGGGAITCLKLVTGERAPEKLRSTVLSMQFDGEETVRAPLIDFFGTGPAWRAHDTLPLIVGADGTLVARFRMPFRQQAIVSLSRDAPGALVVSGEIWVAPHPFGEDTLYFHAGWRPRQSVRTRPFSDWHVATIDGKGHLVGTLLNVENPPGVAWWGEGDEKIYVDGEAFPSHFGTGTEDYFGYAWSTTETFSHAYHAQTRAGSAGFGGPFSMSRFHILDPIPFERGLRFDFEVWHWSDTTLTLDALLYWYARPGSKADFPKP